jgi:hypothetical protein
MFERKKGGWHNTKSKQIAEYFIQERGNPKSLEEIAAVIYPEELYEESVGNKLYSHFTAARRLLRQQGEFIAHPRKHNGKYVLEEDAEGVRKQALTGQVRAKNGFDIMKGGKSFMETKSQKYLAREMVDNMYKFIRKTTDAYLDALFSDDIDKTEELDNNSDPQLLNPTQND